MPEWWTYSLSDFLLFSPRTYYRLIERHNLALWPAHLLTLALGAGIPLLLRRPTLARARAAAAVLVSLWVWVGWSFVARRYATINWAAAYAAWLFALEALLLGWWGMVRGRLRVGRWRAARAFAGASLFVLALALYPLLAAATGRTWAQAETFGIAPDPTVLATVGILLGVEATPRWRGLLLAVPLAWCLLSGATLRTMGAPEAWIMLSGVLLAIAFVLPRGRRAP